MTRDEFWDHIESSKRSDLDEHVERLTKQLAKLPPDEIADFGHWWELSKAEAYRWDLWGAAYTINGGCSDDGFTDFRSWLTLQGRDAFQAALANPDSLADLEVEEDAASCECYPATRAWFKATGIKDDYDAFHAAVEARHPPTQESLARGEVEPTGENWDFDDCEETRRRLPRLAAMYLDRD
ncbi:MAG: DUF4240 domain-containing protein [Planctomycetes bacterium]|nr:DUF4240 domain-containing protein [Planctomycetota bacterium]